MSHNNPYLAKSKHDLENVALAKSVNGVAARVFFQLGASEQRKSTSRWTPRHLVAFNLITESLEGESLKVLEYEAAHRSECPWCNRDSKRESLIQELDLGYSKELLGNGPECYQEMTDSELLTGWRTGHFWAALAKATRTEADHRLELRPQRFRTQFMPAGYVDSITAIPGISSSPSAADRLSEQEHDQEMTSSPVRARGVSAACSSILDVSLSSSPPGLGSSSAFAPSFGDVNEDDLMDRSGLPEQTTVHLSMTFLQCIFGCCLKQDVTALIQGDNSGTRAIKKLEIQARWDRKRSHAHLGEGITIVGEDDGGLSAVALIRNMWRVTDPHIILYEGKNADSECYYDDEKMRLIAPISEKRLAQYLGEAITAWDASDGRDNHMFVMVATNTLIRFIDFRFGDDYESYLRAENTEQQLELVNDYRKDVCVYMNTTRPFCIEKPVDKQAVFCIVLSIMRDGSHVYEGITMSKWSHKTRGRVVEIYVRILG